jgi:hypothetical protein
MHHRDRHSEPPPSYPPPTSGDRQSRPTFGVASGWRPADEDDSPAAVAWRARTGLRRADRALTTIAELNGNVAALNKTITAWSETWGKHWATAAKLAWGVGLPVLVAAILGLGALAWRWVSTLHH